MAEGVDYSSPRVSPAGLAQAGKRFAGRYVGPGGAGKHLTAAERDALFAAGLDIFLLVEGAAGDMQGGYAVGQAHARSAVAAVALLSAPTTAALYAAYDQDDRSWTATQWAVVEQYARGFRDTVGLARAGGYGSIRVVSRLAAKGLITWQFQTYAWSLRKWDQGNHVEQYQNGVALAGGVVDLVRSTATDFGQWSNRRSDDMPKIVRVTDTGAIWITNGPHRYWLTTMDNYRAALTVWHLTAADVTEITAADLAACGVDSTLPGTGGLTLTPEQLIAVSAAASAGAAVGAAGAIDGATIRPAAPPPPPPAPTAAPTTE